MEQKKGLEYWKDLFLLTVYSVAYFFYVIYHIALSPFKKDKK